MSNKSITGASKRKSISGRGQFGLAGLLVLLGTAVALTFYVKASIPATSAAGNNTVKAPAIQAQKAQNDQADDLLALQDQIEAVTHRQKAPKDQQIADWSEIYAPEFEGQRPAQANPAAAQNARLLDLNNRFYPPDSISAAYRSPRDARLLELNR